MKKGAALALSLAAASATADEMPADFPDADDRRSAIEHCLAVDYAFGLAHAYANHLRSLAGDGNEKSTRNVRGRSPAVWVIHYLGGEHIVENQFRIGASWDDNWRSLGQTYWYQMVAEEGSAYTVAEGGVLLDHFMRCLELKSEISPHSGSFYHPGKWVRYTLPEEILAE
ncbi:hypothetical protein ACUXV3_01125 [Roseobacteraceae bacterium NS-SX3]